VKMRNERKGNEVGARLAGELVERSK
jgi:hypothetical protein